MYKVLMPFRALDKVLSGFFVLRQAQYKTLSRVEGFCLPLFESGKQSLPDGRQAPKHHGYYALIAKADAPWLNN